MLKKTLILTAFIFTISCFASDGPPSFAVYLCQVVIDGRPADIGSILSIYDASNGAKYYEHEIKVPGIAGLFTLTQVSEGTELSFSLDGKTLTLKGEPHYFKADMRTYELFLCSGYSDTITPELVRKEFISDLILELEFDETIRISGNKRTLFKSDEPIKKIKYLSLQNGIRIEFISMQSNFVNLEMNGSIEDLSGNSWNKDGKLLVFK